MVTLTRGSFTPCPAYATFIREPLLSRMTLDSITQRGCNTSELLLCHFSTTVGSCSLQPEWQGDASVIWLRQNKQTANDALSIFQPILIMSSCQFAHGRGSLPGLKPGNHRDFISASLLRPQFCPRSTGIIFCRAPVSRLPLSRHQKHYCLFILGAEC